MNAGMLWPQQADGLESKEEIFGFEEEVLPLSPQFGLEEDALSETGNLAIAMGNTELKAARGTLFQPPVRQGRKVPAKFRRPYEFRLEDRFQIQMDRKWQKS